MNHILEIFRVDVIKKEEGASAEFAPVKCGRNG
jgi:hypothetical protein